MLLFRRWCLFCCAACLLFGPSMAQPQAVPARNPVTVDAGMSSRVLACTACHGPEGRSTPYGYYPRIAGKPADYLYHQLLNFRDGRRSYPQMAYLLEHLTDAYLKEMAGYFAALEVPYASPPAIALPTAVEERGRQLVLRGDSARGIPACVQCHGALLTGVAPSVPGLLGLPRDYLNSQLGAWQTAQRRAMAPDCMARVAERLTPADVSAVSGWLATRPVPQGGKPAPTFSGPLPWACGGVGQGVAQERVQ